jgi:hypothetical protein
LEAAQEYIVSVLTSLRPYVIKPGVRRLVDDLEEEFNTPLVGRVEEAVANIEIHGEEFPQLIT